MKRKAGKGIMEKEKDQGKGGRGERRRRRKGEEECNKIIKTFRGGEEGKEESRRRR